MLQANRSVALVDDFRYRLFNHCTVNQIVRQTLRHNIPQQSTSDGCFNNTRSSLSRFAVLDDLFVDTHLYARLEVNGTTGIGTRHFFRVSKDHTFAFRINALTGHVVQAQYDILRRNNDGVTRCWRQNVVCRHHQSTRFELRFERQRYVDRHLVPVKVSVVRRTHERVKLNRLTFNEHRFERLNTQTVERWCSVQKNRVLTNHFGQDIPDLRWLTLNHLLSRFDGAGQTAMFEFAKDKWLE